MKYRISALLIALLAFGAQQSFAADQAAAPAKAVKKAHGKKSAKKEVAAEEKDADVAGATATDFKCALGDQVTVFHRAEDESKIAIRWKKHTHEMMRVDTTTGANRFENPKQGLVWIGIPSKSMLLDSKKGQQLANECRNAQQAEAEAAKG